MNFVVDRSDKHLQRYVLHTLVNKLGLGLNGCEKTAKELVGPLDKLLLMLISKGHGLEASRIIEIDKIAVDDARYAVRLDELGRQEGAVVGLTQNGAFQPRRSSVREAQQRAKLASPELKSSSGYRNAFLPSQN